MPLDAAALRARARAHGQEHLFAFFDALSAPAREKLLAQIAAVEFDVLDRLVAGLVAGPAASAQRLEPAPVVVWPSTPEQAAAQRKAYAAGEEALRAGRVACFLVAGGHSFSTAQSPDCPGVLERGARGV